MSTTTTDIDTIRQLAWTLSKASATNQLDIPGEYVWAFPKKDEFEEVRMRYRSIFSSGNSIKDPAVIDFVQQQNLSKYLLDPWTVEKFEEDFSSYISMHIISVYKITSFLIDQ